MNAKDLFEYRDGGLYWKVQRGRVQAGTKAGTLRLDGYNQIRYAGKYWLEHRLVYLWHKGDFTGYIDHINGVKTDNRIENLRLATHGENQHNQKRNCKNTSGAKGVSRASRNDKWQVRVKVAGRTKYFGCYADLELAELVAVEAREKLHGQYARHA